jgi:hypothetical protein
MIGRFAVAVTVLTISLGATPVLFAPAIAAPFAEFEVIMWQDHTPAEMAGLSRLGFTGVKLMGTGGRIDASKLVAEQASGLPWYVENIATDFFSPYHRYTPGKPVTWLFDTTKARLFADPVDTAVFVRAPSLSDPGWLASIRARLDAVVRGQSQYRPLFYNLGDEAGIGDLAAAWDADIAPVSLAAMRTWLRTQYSDLPALNRQWGSNFTDWDAVMPELTDTAMRRTDDNYSAWADFKAWMDVAFARAVQAGTEAVHQADPTALAGLEGGQIPGWGGYDYSLLAPAVDVMEIYDVGNAVELARAFHPNLVSLRTSFATGPREVHAAWRHLLRGGRGMIVWDERNDVVQADGEPGPRGLAIQALVTAIRVVAPELMASKPAFDPVDVLYSQASFRTRWMLDQRGRGVAWSRRDAAREYEDNAWRASRRQVLQRLSEIGIQPRLLSSAMVEAGALRHDGSRALILPHTIALSQAETDEIRDFARRGGTVLADTEPGLFDQHSRRLPAPLLSGVAALPDAMMLDGGQISSDTLAAFGALLRDADVVARAQLLGPDGQTATGVDAVWLRHGDSTILALQTVAPWGAPARIEVRFSKPVSVEDMRIPGRSLRAERIVVDLDPITPTILRLGH